MIGPAAEAAIRQIIASAQYNIVQARADLARMTVVTHDEFYHQGYQVGRIAELESKVESLQLLLRMGSKGTEARR